MAKTRLLNSKRRKGKCNNAEYSSESEKNLNIIIHMLLARERDELDNISE